MRLLKGRFGPIYYPSRSPDFTPLEFSSRSLKKTVYSNDQPYARKELKERLEALNELNAMQNVRKVYELSRWKVVTT